MPQFVQKFPKYIFRINYI